MSRVLVIDDSNSVRSTLKAKLDRPVTMFVFAPFCFKTEEFEK
jgi:hypothetical protein